MKRMAAKLMSTPSALQTALASFELLFIFLGQTHYQMKGMKKKSLAISWKSAKIYNNKKKKPHSRLLKKNKKTQVKWMSTSCSILFFYYFTTRPYLDLSDICLRCVHILFILFQSGKSKLLHNCQFWNMRSKISSFNLCKGDDGIGILHLVNVCTE